MKNTSKLFFLIATLFIFSCASKKIVTNATSVPKLSFTVDCGKCEYRESGAALITEGYEMAAKENGLPISKTDIAIVTIKDYNARNNAARFWVGAMAGRDTIKTSVQFKNKTFEVEDFYANAVQGIDDLARSIGKDIFKEIVK